MVGRTAGYSNGRAKSNNSDTKAGVDRVIALAAAREMATLCHVCIPLMNECLLPVHMSSRPSLRNRRFSPNDMRIVGAAMSIETSLFLAKCWSPALARRTGVHPDALGLWAGELNVLFVHVIGGFRKVRISEGNDRIEEKESRTMHVFLSQEKEEWDEEGVHLSLF